MINLSSLKVRWQFWPWAWLSFCVLMAAFTAGADENLSKTGALTLADLRRLVSEHGRVIRSFHLAGVVCAVVPRQRLVVLRDDSATALLKLPTVDADLHAGDRLVITGENSLLINGDFCIQIGTAPVVDNDGRHPVILKSGKVFLPAGFQPIRLAWYNYARDAILNVEWEGPGLRRQPVPSAALWWEPAGSTNLDELKPGLDYTASNGKGDFLADFENRAPVGQGVAINFDVAYRFRPEHTALFFSGYLQAPRAGIYTFYVTADDGAQLQVGESRVSCRRLPAGQASLPAILKLDQIQAATGGSAWIESEGEVTFAGVNRDQLEIEMAAEGDRFPVTIVGGAPLLATDLLHERIRVSGICEFSVAGKKIARIVVPSPAQLEILGSETEAAGAAGTNRFLTSVAQVQQLSPEQLRQEIPAKIRGIVVGSLDTGLMVQDATGGISVHFRTSDWTEQPRVGELLEVEGMAVSGLFAPAIVAQKVTRLGNGALPEPIRPRWDQLINGTLDCVYVEIEGILIGASGSEMTLLCPDGILTVEVVGRRTDNLDFLLPGFAANETTVMDSLVRLRGCCMPGRDQQARHMIRGQIYMNSPLLTVEELAPRDPFALPTKKIAGLLWFDPRAGALQRTKLTGQVMHVQSGEYMVLEQKRGFRVLTAQPANVEVGDLIEAVGFPKLDGPSPVLQQAQIRKIKAAPLPAPVPVSDGELLDRNLDATLVQVEATLVGETARLHQRILELQSGPRHFQAFQNASPGSTVNLPVGSRLRLVGVYAAASGNHMETSSDPFSLLLLDGAGAIRVLERPSWWTVKHAVILTATLAGILGLALVWIMLLRQKVELRTAQLRAEIQERQRAEQDQAIEQERTRVAQDLHDELGAGLTTVGLLGELVKNPATPPEKKPGYLEQITQAAHSLVTALDEIVWAVNPKHDSIASSANYYAYFAQPFLNAAGIACRLEITGSLSEQKMDPRLRHGVFLAFKEALNNVVRHSGATEVTIKILTQDGQLIIAIADNGNGIDAARSQRWPSQDGMAGIRDRIASFSGECRITSEVGMGTTVEFRIPLVPPHSERDAGVAAESSVRTREDKS